MTKVCPLCGSRFGQEVERCPDDGRILIRVRKSEAGESDGSVKLSSATEELLGDILTSSADQEVKGGSSSSNALADLEFDIDVEIPHGQPKPSNPLEDFSLEDFSISDSFASIQRQAGEEEDPDEVEAASRSAGALFDELALEVDTLLDEDVEDDEVTRKIAREDLNIEATRRSEMPPEFMEALAREREEEEARAAAEAEGASTEAEGAADGSEAPAQEGEDREAKAEEDAEPEVQRELPRHSQLNVQRATYVLSSERPPLPLIPIAIALAVTVVILLAIWFAT